VVSAVDPGPPPDAGERVVLVWWDRTPRPPAASTARLAAAWHRPVEVGPARPLTQSFPLHPGVTFRVDAAEIRAGAAAPPPPAVAGRAPEASGR
jgi:hypothetical protein